jgi:hypothetical protein
METNKQTVILTNKQIEDGCAEAYEKAGHNAYFSSGFHAGVKFALKQVNEDNNDNDNDNDNIMDETSTTLFKNLDVRL